MNKINRSNIKSAIRCLKQARDIVSACMEKELDSIDNISGTSLEFTSMYEKLEMSSDNMDSAITEIESAISYLEECIL